MTSEDLNQPESNRPSIKQLMLASPVTMVLIAISVGLALFSQFGSSRAILMPLLFADPMTMGFAAILSGEVWRLVTPIFIHFGILHIVFNMLWLWDLGITLEVRKGHWFILSFVLIVGVLSNLVQFLMTKSPFFGGMSGVVYGLLGYLWVHGRLYPQFGIVLHKHIAVMMLIWFVICWLGVVGPIANWAHTAGLVLGLVWGCVKPNLFYKKI